MEGLTINKEQQVAFVQKEEGYVITRRDWSRIKKSLSKLCEPSSIWSNIGWGALGIGVPCIVSWSMNIEIWLYLLFGVLGLGVAICSYFASKQGKNNFKATLKNFEDVVSEIEEAMVPKDIVS